MTLAPAKSRSLMRRQCRKSRGQAADSPDVVQRGERSGCVKIFHQPEIWWLGGYSPHKPPFGARSCEVVIFHPGNMFPRPALCRNPLGNLRGESSWSCVTAAKPRFFDQPWAFPKKKPAPSPAARHTGHEKSTVALELLGLVPQLQIAKLL